MARRTVDQIIVHHVMNKGIWVLKDLRTYMMVHYPRKFCHVVPEDGSIIVRDDSNGAVYGIFTMDYFNVTWNYDKRYLIRACEERTFQNGIYDIRQKYKL